MKILVVVDMQYDFTTIMDRRGKDAIAVDAPAGNNTGNDFFAAIRDQYHTCSENI